MRAFIRSRNMIPLTWICLGSLALVFSPWGSVPAPYLDLGLPGPLVPLRAIAVVAVGYLPLLTLSPETRIPDVSSPRSARLLHSLAPTVLTVIAAAAAAAGAAIAGVDALAAVRNLLLGTATAAALYRVMGPLSFVPPVLGATRVVGHHQPARNFGRVPCRTSSRGHVVAGRRPAADLIPTSASAATNRYGPSLSGRVRNAATCSSRSLAISLTVDLLSPVMPRVRTSMSILRVLTPSR